MRSQGECGFRKEAEGDPRIAAVHEINKVVHHFVAPAEVGLRFEPGFGGAIGQDDSEGKP